MVIDPDFGLIAEHDGKAVAFALAIVGPPWGYRCWLVRLKGLYVCLKQANRKPEWFL